MPAILGLIQRIQAQRTQKKENKKGEFSRKFRGVGKQYE